MSLHQIERRLVESEDRMAPPEPPRIQWAIDFLETVDGQFTGRITRVTHVGAREESVEEFRVEDPEAYLRLRS
jgi:hypothetical protein